MPTLLPHKIEKENPAQKWGNLVAKSKRAVGSNLLVNNKNTPVIINEGLVVVVVGALEGTKSSEKTG
jgi:hypothetical protein